MKVESLISFYYSLLYILVLKWVQTKKLDIRDVCGDVEGKRFYLELADKGILRAVYQNNTSTVYREEDIHENATNQNRCSVEFVTCTSCVVNINFRYLNTSGFCGRSPIADQCGCEYVWIYEPQYEDISGQHFCGRFIENNGTYLSYTSKTRRVAINFLYGAAYDHVFTLDYASERNKVEFFGKSGRVNYQNSSQALSSPFFPHFYPSDLNLEYTWMCKPPDNCKICLIFTDFRIAPESIIEVFDTNRQRMYVASGKVFRPPILISSGPKMGLLFYGNGGSSLGFRASYSYISDDNSTSIWKPNTNCGGFVTNLGGGITMMNMVANGTGAYDCIWIIKPPNSYLHMKTHLSVKVATFSDLEGGSELRIRSGVSSNAQTLEVLRSAVSQFLIYKPREHIVPLSQGFYIRLKANFRAESRLAIVYTAFNYKECFAGSDFLCNNLRCISILLRCDGLDHCGDNSDETTLCSTGLLNKRPWTKRPNFLFQHIDRYTDLAPASLIFLAGCLGLIGLIFSMTLLIIHRENLRDRHHRRIQDHIQTIHAILEESVINVEEEIIIPDDPPDYEAPPDYSDLSKLLLLKHTTNLQHVSNEQTKLHDIRASNNHPEVSNLENHSPVDVEVNHSSSSVEQTSVSAGIPGSPPPSYRSNESLAVITTDVQPSLLARPKSSSLSSSTSERSKSSSNLSLFEKLLQEEVNKRMTISPRKTNYIRPRHLSDSALTYLVLEEVDHAHLENLSLTFTFRKGYSSDSD